jgi:hypothetical protein
LQEQRLFHRYPAELKVGFRTGKKSYRGRLANVSVGGGYIVTDARPRLGARVQMAARRDSQERSIWLDLRVARTVESSDDSSLEPGFGGFWLHASSRHSEERLRVFLDEVLGITRAVIRPMTSPSGGKTVYVYKFPDVYAQGVFEELPWLENGNAGAMDYRRSRGQKPLSAESEEADSRGDADYAVGEAPSSTIARPVLEGTAASDIPTSGSSEATTRDVGVADVTEESRGRWDFLVKKLSGIRMRGDDSTHNPSTMDIAGVTCEYRIGRLAFAAVINKCGADWVVFEPSARIPEVWSRIVLTFHYFDAAEGAKSEVHATVTRLKETPDGQLVHCKINQVEEKESPGAYHHFVQRFNS